MDSEQYKRKFSEEAQKLVKETVREKGREEEMDKFTQAFDPVNAFFIENLKRETFDVTDSEDKKKVWKQFKLYIEGALQSITELQEADPKQVEEFASSLFEQYYAGVLERIIGQERQAKAKAEGEQKKAQAEKSEEEQDEGVTKFVKDAGKKLFTKESAGVFARGAIFSFLMHRTGLAKLGRLGWMIRGAAQGFAVAVEHHFPRLKSHSKGEFGESPFPAELDNRAYQAKESLESLAKRAKAEGKKSLFDSDLINISAVFKSVCEEISATVEVRKRERGVIQTFAGEIHSITLDEFVDNIEAPADITAAASDEAGRAAFARAYRLNECIRGIDEAEFERLKNASEEDKKKFIEEYLKKVKDEKNSDSLHKFFEVSALDRKSAEQREKLVTLYNRYKTFFPLLIQKRAQACYKDGFKAIEESETYKELEREVWNIQGTSGAEKDKILKEAQESLKAQLRAELSYGVVREFTLFQETILQYQMMREKGLSEEDLRKRGRELHKHDILYGLVTGDVRSVVGRKRSWKGFWEDALAASFIGAGASFARGSVPWYLGGTSVWGSVALAIPTALARLGKRLGERQYEKEYADMFSGEKLLEDIAKESENFQKGARMTEAGFRDVVQTYRGHIPMLDKPAQARVRLALLRLQESYHAHSKQPQAVSEEAFKAIGKGVIAEGQEAGAKMKQALGKLDKLIKERPDNIVNIVKYLRRLNKDVRWNIVKGAVKGLVYTIPAGIIASQIGGHFGEQFRENVLSEEGWWGDFNRAVANAENKIVQLDLPGDFLEAGEELTEIPEPVERAQGDKDGQGAHPPVEGDGMTYGPVAYHRGEEAHTTGLPRYLHEQMQSTDTPIDTPTELTRALAQIQGRVSFLDDLLGVSSGSREINDQTADKIAAHLVRGNGEDAANFIKYYGALIENLRDTAPWKLEAQGKALEGYNFRDNLGPQYTDTVRHTITHFAPVIESLGELVKGYHRAPGGESEHHPSSHNAPRGETPPGAPLSDDGKLHVHTLAYKPGDMEVRLAQAPAAPPAAPPDDPLRYVGNAVVDTLDGLLGLGIDTLNELEGKGKAVGGQIADSLAALVKSALVLGDATVKRAGDVPRETWDDLYTTNQTLHDIEDWISDKAHEGYEAAKEKYEHGGGKELGREIGGYAREAGKAPHIKARDFVFDVLNFIETLPEDYEAHKRGAGGRHINPHDAAINIYEMFDKVKDMTPTEQAIFFKHLETTTGLSRSDLEGARSAEDFAEGLQERFLYGGHRGGALEAPYDSRGAISIPEISKEEGLPTTVRDDIKNKHRDDAYMDKIIDEISFSRQDQNLTSETDLQDDDRVTIRRRDGSETRIKISEDLKEVCEIDKLKDAVDLYVRVLRHAQGKATYSVNNPDMDAIMDDITGITLEHNATENDALESEEIDKAIEGNKAQGEIRL